MSRERISPEIAELQNRRTNLEHLRAKHEGIQAQLTEQIGAMPLTADLSAIDQDMRLADTADFAKTSVEKFTTKIEVTASAIDQKAQEGLAKLQSYVERGLISQAVYEKRVSEVQGLALMSGTSQEPQLTEGTKTPTETAPTPVADISPSPVLQTEVSMEQSFIALMEQSLIDITSEGVSISEVLTTPEPAAEPVAETKALQEQPVQIEKESKTKRIVITRAGKSETFDFESRGGNPNKSYELLKLLASRPDGGFISKEITEHLYPDREDAPIGSVLVGNTRLKIEDNRQKPRIIVDQQVNIEEDPKAKPRLVKEYYIAEDVTLSFPDEVAAAEEAQLEAPVIEPESISFIGEVVHESPINDVPQLIEDAGVEDQTVEAPIRLEHEEVGGIKVSNESERKLAEIINTRLGAGEAVESGSIAIEIFGEDTKENRVKLRTTLNALKPRYAAQGKNIVNITTVKERFGGAQARYAFETIDAAEPAPKTAVEDQPQIPVQETESIQSSEPEAALEPVTEEQPVAETSFPAFLYESSGSSQTSGERKVTTQSEQHPIFDALAEGQKKNNSF